MPTTSTRPSHYWLNLGDVDIDTFKSLKLGLRKLQSKSQLLWPMVPLAQPAVKHSRDGTTIELKNVGSTSHEILFRARTIFPFDFFPDTITFDREKITIVQRVFVLTARIISVPVRDILSVQLNVGPFFGSVMITSRYASANKTYDINFLTRMQAFKLQRLLQGYIIANERLIDCRAIPLPQLKRMLMDIGRGLA